MSGHVRRTPEIDEPVIKNVFNMYRTDGSKSRNFFDKKSKHTVRGIHWAEVPIFLKENRKALISGKKVLDFGSGSGVVALAAARDGAERVIGCDSDKDALEAIRANAELNRVPIEVIRSLGELKGEVDIILVADLLYDFENFPLVDRFFDYTDQILLGDSRIKHFQHPRYHQVDHITSETIRDLSAESNCFDFSNNSQSVTNKQIWN